MRSRAPEYLPEIPAEQLIALSMAEKWYLTHTGPDMIRTAIDGLVAIGYAVLETTTPDGEFYRAVATARGRRYVERVRESRDEDERKRTPRRCAPTDTIYGTDVTDRLVGVNPVLDAMIAEGCDFYECDGRLDALQLDDDALPGDEPRRRYIPEVIDVTCLDFGVEWAGAGR